MVQDARGRRRSTAGQLDSQIEIAIASSLAKPLGELRTVWRDRLGSEPPTLKSRELTLRMLAWRLQAQTLGGLDATTERRLDEIASALEGDAAYEPKAQRQLSAGVVVTREWKGVVHKVTVIDDAFEYQRKRFNSLSEIARLITGTRWSGPRFFGLEQKTDQKARVAA